MILALLLWLAQDAYVTVPLSKISTTARTHVCTVAPVTYVRKQKDGDYHVTLDDGRSKVVAEIIPQIPFPPPKKGQRVKVCGITRYDKWHHWSEIHPVTSITVVK
jgi:hypothetical protein